MVYNAVILKSVFKVYRYVFICNEFLNKFSWNDYLDIINIQYESRIVTVRKVFIIINFRNLPIQVIQPILVQFCQKTKKLSLALAFLFIKLMRIGINPNLRFSYCKGSEDIISIFE